MHYVFTFTTSKFDVTKEDKNDINPIYGQSFLLWLKDQAKGRIEIDNPGCEDWGWYAYAVWEGQRYLLGASTDDSQREDSGEYYWFFHVSHRRSVWNWLLGRGKGLEDGCLRFFKAILDAEPGFHNLKLEL